MIPRPLRACTALLLAVSAGCASSYRQLDSTVALYRQGDLEAAADRITSEEFDDDRDGSRHGVLWLLETGKVLHDVGRFEASEKAFARADARIRENDREAAVSITDELAGVLTTQQAREFRTRHWQKILLETYRALNQLAIGDRGEALVFARRSYARQADAVFERGEEIERRREAVKDRRVHPDGLTSQGGVQAILDPVKSRITPAYADYANPFTSYLAALLQWADGDTTRAVVDLRKAHEMVPGNAFVEALLAELENDLPLGSPRGRVYVIFENGLAPERAEQGVRIVTPNGYSSFVLPSLVYHDSPVEALEASGAAGALNLRTAPLADVDAMVSVDFADELPGIVVRTVLSVVTKEVTTKQLRDQHQGWGFVIGTLWKAATEGADLRTWRTVGSGFQVAHFERPASGVVRVNLLDRFGGRHLETTLEIPPRTVSWLLARSVNLASLRCHVVPGGDPVPDDAAAERDAPPEAAPERKDDSDGGCGDDSGDDAPDDPPPALPETLRDTSPDAHDQAAGECSAVPPSPNDQPNIAGTGRIAAREEETER